jgi:hypothetical protein
LGDACDTDDDNDGMLDAADSCPLAPSDGFDADSDGCPDTLPGFLAYLTGLEDVRDSFGRNVLRWATRATSLLCDDGDTRAGVQRLNRLAAYTQRHSAKQISVDTAAVLESYVDNLIEQLQDRRDVCSSP